MSSLTDWEIDKKLGCWTVWNNKEHKWLTSGRFKLHCNPWYFATEVEAKRAILIFEGKQMDLSDEAVKYMLHRVCEEHAEPKASKESRNEVIKYLHDMKPEIVSQFKHREPIRTMFFRPRRFYDPKSQTYGVHFPNKNLVVYESAATFYSHNLSGLEWID